MNLRMIGFCFDIPNNCSVMADKSSEAAANSLTVPWSDTARFLRQLSHDLRNDLNAIELQSAYIGELAQDQELTNEIKRLREVVSGMNSTLQLLSKAVGDVAPNLVAPHKCFLAPDPSLKQRRDISSAHLVKLLHQLLRRRDAKLELLIVGT